MNSGWVAASVRARAMALRRLGVGLSARVATQADLPTALALLQNTAYSQRMAGVTDLPAADRAIRATVLWQLRVLAAWLPPGGTPLARLAAAGLERDNIVALAHELETGNQAPEPFELGGLSTAWPRLAESASLDELRAGLTRSPWGDPGDEPVANWRPVLTLDWLRRLASIEPAVAPWVRAQAVLMVAKRLLIDRSVFPPRLLTHLRPLLGTAWEQASDLDGLRAAIPASVRPVLAGITSVDELWRAEANLCGTVEEGGFRLLRGAQPGPDIVLGAIVVLATDAWRLHAALAAASVGLGSSEVLDVVA